MLPVMFVIYRGKIEGRVHFVFVIDTSDKIFLNLVDTVRLDTENCPVILDSEKYMTAIPV